MNGCSLAALPRAGTDIAGPFTTEIVGERAGRLELASRAPIEVQRAVGTIDASDIVIVPSVLLPATG